MYTLKTEDSFDSAHFLYNYEGKCKNIHGHRWRVIVEIKSQSLDTSPQTRGMLVDFSQLKKDLKKETDLLDHALIIEKNSLKAKTLEALLEENFSIIELDFRPTAENMAKYFFKKMEEKGYNIKNVTIYETPNNCASYEE